jgi:two-component system, NarL family, captular synthesis response regulator RcsB
MIKKVLIAEDHESTNISLQKTLEELKIDIVDYVYYCDDALLRITKSNTGGQPYDLLITDLYFEADFRQQQIAGGSALITACREVQPDLKVLVFSAEAKPAIIEGLFQNIGIDGYVRKARSDAKELKQAIASIDMNQRHFPRNLQQYIKKKNAHNFTDADIAIIELLAHGVRQKDIPEHLQKKQIKPSGLSSVEKRLNLMKEEFDFSNNEQLVAYCKDLGII